MGKKSPRRNHTEHHMAKALDDLAAFEDYKNEVLPILRRAIAENWPPEKIEKHPKIAALLVARQVTMALTELDSSKAMAAIKDARDRSQGKPIERKEIKAQIESLPDEQLDEHLAALMGSDDEHLPS